MRCKEDYFVTRSLLCDKWNNEQGTSNQDEALDSATQKNEVENKNIK